MRVLSSTLIKNRVAFAAIILTAAVLIAAVCFYWVLPDDIKPGSKNPQKVSTLEAASSSYDSVKLTWSAAHNATGYEIFRSSEENGDYKKCGDTDTNEYVDPNLDTGTEYWYMIRSTRGNRKSRYSPRVKAMPLLDKPGLKGASTEDGAEIVSDKVEGATGYAFFKDGKLLREQPANVCHDGNLKINEEHDYQVAAFRTVGGNKVMSGKSKPVKAGRIHVDMSLEDGNSIETIYSGEKVELSGRIKSNVSIRKIEIGAMDESGKNWIEGQKYEKDDIDDKEFDMKLADASIKFGDLPAGRYRFKVLAYPEGGKATVLSDQAFEVDDNPSMAAVKWAIDIANDDSFTYGTGKSAHKRGCYFCGTNKRFKPAGYEKTYCCNPFVFAAYAHGAGNEIVLEACRKGACGGMLPSDWTKYGCFETLGTTKEFKCEDLRAGDFIISRKADGGPYEHVWMYIGGDQYVEASGGGWHAGSIAVKSGIQSYYKKYQTNGCYVMRYTGN